MPSGQWCPPRAMGEGGCLTASCAYDVRLQVARHCGNGLPGGLASGHHAIDVLECIFQGFGVIAPVVVIYPLDEIVITPCFENLVAGGMLVGGVLLQKKDEEAHFRT